MAISVDASCNNAIRNGQMIKPIAAEELSVFRSSLSSSNPLDPEISAVN